jgi:predicted aspartyl protease
MVVASLPGGKKFNLVVDSGATITLIGQDLVQNSPYLSSLPLESTEKYKICIADGSYIYSTTKIHFDCQIQGVAIPISAHIVPSFGLVNCLLGTNDLKRLKATLDFDHNILKLTLPNTVKFYTPRTFFIRPHCTRYVTLKAKLPSHLSSGDIQLNTTKACSKLTVHSFLTHVQKAKCIVPMHNDSDKTIKLSSSVCLATADGSSLINGPAQPMSDL